MADEQNINVNENTNPPMVDEIIAELTIELQESDGSFSLALLTSKVKSAYRAIKNYAECTDEEMEKYHDNVYGLSLYRYSKVGAEGETENSESGVKRIYVKEAEYFSGILPKAKIV